MIFHYIKSFLRSLKKNRFFYSINLIGFTTGFLVITIILTFVYQELSFDRFNKNGADIYRIHSGGYGVTPLCFGEKLKNQIPEITGIVRFNLANLIIAQNGKEVRFDNIYYTDPEIFSVFSFKLISGDPATVLKTPYSIVINKSTANRLFGKKPAAGDIIRDKDGTIYTVTGVMEDIPYNSHITANGFVSIETLKNKGADILSDCGSWDILTYVCLAENTNWRKTEEKINSLLADSRMGPKDNKMPLKLEQLKKIYFDPDNNKYDGSRHGNMQTVIFYVAIAFLILVIVVINYINLSTTISGNRISEIAIRKINGAGKGHIIKQVLTEALGVAVISFLITMTIIKFLLPDLSNMLNIPVSGSTELSALFLYYFAGIVVIGIITGVVPGIFLAGVSEIKAMKNESVSSTRGSNRKILLTVQLIIVAVMLNSTLIINKQINYILNKDLGFNYENIVCLELSQDFQDKYEVLKNELLKNPKIKSISFSTGLMGEGLGKSPKSIDGIEKLCYFNSVDPDYIGLYQLKIKYGRNFSSDLKTDLNNSCIVNEAACKAFGIENPVGKSADKREIIGVVDDFNFTSLHDNIEPLVFYCHEGKVAQAKISGDNQAETIDYIKKTCKEISSDFECNISFLNTRIEKLYKAELDLRSSFIIYSIITFIIALTGLFGLILFLVKKKTREIGTPKLFGASLTDTFMLFSKEQVTIAIISNLLAIPVSSLVMNGWLNNFRYRIDIGFLVFFETSLIITALILLAISLLIIEIYKSDLTAALKSD